MKRTNGLVHAAAVFVVAALLAGAMPGRTLAAVQGGEFTSETFGFSLTWDGTVWTDEDPELANDAEGVNLNSLSSWVMVMGIAAAGFDPDACLGYMEANWGEDNASVLEFGPAPRRVAKPESPVGGGHGLYAVQMEGDNGPTDLYYYLECLPMQGSDAALTITMVTLQRAYEDELPAWEDLLGAIEVDDAGTSASSGQSGDTGTAGGDGRYEDPAGYAVSWDDGVWTGAAWDDETGTGVELDNGTSLGYLRAIPADDELRFCPEGLAFELNRGETFTKVRNAPGAMERPEAAEGEVGALYTAVIDGSLAKYAVYIACRELSADTFLTVIFFADATDYAVELPAWQAILDATTTGDATGDERTTDGQLGRQRAAEPKRPR